MKKKAMSPAERKRRQREREKKLGVADLRLSTTEKERELVHLMAERQGYEDTCEYVMSLVMADCDTSQSNNCGKRDVLCRVNLLKEEADNDK